MSLSANVALPRWPLASDPIQNKLNETFEKLRSTSKGSTRHPHARTVMMPSITCYRFCSADRTDAMLAAITQLFIFGRFTQVLPFAKSR